MPEEYFCLTADEWNLIFAAIQAVAVLVGVPYGLYQLRELRSSRSKASIEKMFEEWRKDPGPRDRVRAEFPMFGAGPASDRAGRLLQWMHDAQAAQATTSAPSPRIIAELLSDAREVIERVSDLGSYVELGIVEERHFFAQFHFSVIQLVFLLEPYLLLRTALRGGNRWGMRLRRLRVGAERYQHWNPLHRTATITLRGTTILQPDPSRPLVVLPRLRFMPDRQRFRPDDESAIEATQQEIRKVSEGWGLAVDEMDKWFGPI